jgi:hypothetical protein
VDYVCTGSQIHHILKTKVALLLTSRLPVQKGTGNVRHPLATALSSSQRLHESEAERTDLTRFAGLQNRLPCSRPPELFFFLPPANPGQRHSVIRSRCNWMVLCDPDSNHFSSNSPHRREGAEDAVTPSPRFMGDHPCARRQECTLTAAGRTQRHVLFKMKKEKKRDTAPRRE